jgi:membrane protein
MRLQALRATGIVRLAERVVRSFFEHRMATYAAALAYRALFGLFPFVLIVVVLVGFLGPPNYLDRLAEEATSQSSGQVPDQLKPVVEQTKGQLRPLEEMVQQAEKQAGGDLLLFGIGAALWAVSAVANTLAEAFNTVYGIVEDRRGWKRLALTLASGPIIALAVVVAMGLMLTGPQVAGRIAEVLGVRGLFVLLWGWLRFPVALMLLWVALSVVYRHGSAARQHFRSVVLGAAFAVVAWAIVSVGFSSYLANFADYGVTYGSLGAAVGLLLYLDLSASIVLAGAELNAAIHSSAGTTGSQKPDSDREISGTEARRTGDA